ncbi:hypothetical protein [Cryobacterium sp. Hz7]|nr:hypothetical protein [Cryobacterium sp. Hz7]
MIKIATDSDAQARTQALGRTEMPIMTIRRSGLIGDVYASGKISWWEQV